MLFAHQDDGRQGTEKRFKFMPGDQKPELIDPEEQKIPGNQEKEKIRSRDLLDGDHAGQDAVEICREILP